MGVSSIVQNFSAFDEWNEAKSRYRVIMFYPSLDMFAPRVFERHHYWMDRALALANEAGAAGDIPVGAVITDAAGQLLASAANRKERDCDPTAHAEILALRTAGERRRTWHLNDCTLYVTLEPCPMCAGAILQARVGLLVYGAPDPKSGAVRTVENLLDHACSSHRLPVIAGLRESACQECLQQWFIKRRQQNQRNDQ